jgi:hypothetical protein
MKPDEATLALWLDDELTGSELDAVEAWAAGQSDQIAIRASVRQWRAMMASAIPSNEEPPYPDFFNHRVIQEIGRLKEKTAGLEKKNFSWRSWLVPSAACAGMALAFFAGTRSHRMLEVDVTGAPKAIPVDPVIYTPERGVNAEWFASSEASAMVIVLNGVAAIPDTTDFSATVCLPSEREIDSTASREVKPTTAAKP